MIISYDLSIAFSDGQTTSISDVSYPRHDGNWLKFSKADTENFVNLAYVYTYAVETVYKRNEHNGK